MNSTGSGGLVRAVRAGMFKEHASCTNFSYFSFFPSTARSPLSAEDAVLEGAIRQQCRAACENGCGEEGLMQGLETYRGFKQAGAAHVGERQEGIIRISNWKRCWLLQMSGLAMVVILKNNSHM